MRAQEHLNNTPRHVALQQALGFRTPRYSHMPLIFNMDGTKMSKRDKAKAARAVLQDAMKKDGALTAEAVALRLGLDAAGVKGFLAKENDSLEVAEAVGRGFGVAMPEVEVADFRDNGYLPGAITNFLSSFEGPSDGATVLSLDKLGEPLVLDESFFFRGGDRSNPKLDRGRIQAIKLIAEALKDPDEIWWQWADAKAADGSPRPRLSRRYISRFSIDGKERSYIVVMQYGQGGWRGVTAFKNSDQAYLDSDNVRGGVLAYRRDESR